jgi:hypothetical protein
MADWQATVATVYCDAVDDDVTTMVYKDRGVRFTGHRKYAESLDKEAAQTLRRKARRLGRNLVCEGPLDCKVTDYRDRLTAQDKAISARKKQAEKERA